MQTWYQRGVFLVKLSGYVTSAVVVITLYIFIWVLLLFKPSHVSLGVCSIKHCFWCILYDWFHFLVRDKLSERFENIKQIPMDNLILFIVKAFSFFSTFFCFLNSFFKYCWLTFCFYWKQIHECICYLKAKAAKHKQLIIWEQVSSEKDLRPFTTQ